VSTFFKTVRLVLDRVRVGRLDIVSMKKLLLIHPRLIIDTFVNLDQKSKSNV